MWEVGLISVIVTSFSLFKSDHSKWLALYFRTLTSLGKKTWWVRVKEKIVLSVKQFFLQICENLESWSKNKKMNLWKEIIWNGGGGGDWNFLSLTILGLGVTFMSSTSVYLCRYASKYFIIIVVNKQDNNFILIPVGNNEAYFSVFSSHFISKCGEFGFKTKFLFCN
jgi:hypothetical protein